MTNLIIGCVPYGRDVAAGLSPSYSSCRAAGSEFVDGIGAVSIGFLDGVADEARYLGHGVEMSAKRLLVVGEFAAKAGERLAMFVQHFRLRQALNGPVEFVEVTALARVRCLDVEIGVAADSGRLMLDRFLNPSDDGGERGWARRGRLFGRGGARQFRAVESGFLLYGS
jgi:hypothetical protein